MAADVKDFESLRSFLKDRSPYDAIAIAGRAVMRMLPLAVLLARRRGGENAPQQIDALISVLFRASAIAQTAGKYPDQIKVLSQAAKLAASAADELAGATPFTRAAASLSRTVFVAAHPTAETAVHAAETVDNAATFLARANLPEPGNAYFAGVPYQVGVPYQELHDEAYRNALRQVDLDTPLLIRDGAADLIVAPLWLGSAPAWVPNTWPALSHAMPKDEHWSVWIDWYFERISGRFPPEDYELVFASVPEMVWRDGAASANAWIRAELDKLRAPKPSATSPGAPAEPTTDRTRDRLASLGGRPAPVELKFNAEGRIALVHRAAIVAFPSRPGGGDLHKLQEACRESATRLAGDVRAELFDNFRDAHFLLALDRYAADIPLIDRDGNILLADDSVDELSELAVEFEAVLPNSFARRLRQFLAKHEELRVYYVETKALDEARQAVAPLPSPPEAFVANIANAIEGPAADAFDPEARQALARVLRPTPKVELEPGEARRPVDPAARQKHDYRILSSLARLWELITAKPVREGPGQLAAVYNTINLVKTYVWPYLEALIAWLSQHW